MSTGLADLGEISKAYRRTRKGEERENPRPRPKRDRINSFPITDDDIGHWESSFRSPTDRARIERAKEGQRKWERGELHPDARRLYTAPPKQGSDDAAAMERWRSRMAEYDAVRSRAAGKRTPVPLRDPSGAYDYDTIFESNTYGGGVKHTISQRRAERAARSATPHGRRVFGRKGYIDRRGVQ